MGCGIQRGVQCCLRVIREVRAEPTLDFLEFHLFALGVLRDLVGGHLANVKVVENCKHWRENARADDDVPSRRRREGSSDGLGLFGFGHEDKHVHKLVRATDREKNHGVFDELVLGVDGVVRVVQLREHFFTGSSETQRRRPARVSRGRVRVIDSTRPFRVDEVHVHDILDGPFEERDVRHRTERPDHVAFPHHNAAKQETTKPNVHEIQHPQKWVVESDREQLCGSLK